MQFYIIISRDYCFIQFFQINIFIKKELALKFKKLDINIIALPSYSNYHFYHNYAGINTNQY